MMSEPMPTRKEMLRLLELHDIIFSRALQENLSYSTMYHIYDIFKKYESGIATEMSINLFKYGLSKIGIHTKETKSELLGKIGFAKNFDYDN